MSQSLFSQPLNVINVGIAMFSDDLKKQHVEVTQLDWTPPGQGNMQVVQALDNIADSPLADKIAASFIRFSRSAPEKPGVPFAMEFRSTSSPSGLPRA